MSDEIKVSSGGFDNEFSAVDYETLVKEATDDSSNPDGSETPKVETVVEKVAQQKFTKVIPGIDGAGDEVFTADTLDDLVDQLAKAKEHASKKIHDLAKKAKPSTAVEPVRVKEEPKPLTAEQRRDLAEKFAIDPITAIEEYLKGNPQFQAFEQFTQTQQAQITQRAAEAEFLTEVGEKFHPSPKNEKAMINFLRSEDLPYTAESLSYAFEQLSESGLLETKQESKDDANESDPKKVVIKEHVRTKPQSTGIRSRHIASQRAEEETEPNKEVDAAVSKALQETDLDKARQLMLAAMAGQKKKALSNI